MHSVYGNVRAGKTPVTRQDKEKRMSKNKSGWFWTESTGSWRKQLPNPAVVGLPG